MITFSQLGRYGRLGNQMFQIASTIGIAIKNGYDYAFPEWKNYDAAERFGSKEDIDVQKWFKNRLPIKSIMNEYPQYAIPFGFHGFDIPDNVSLSGHMQSEKYFEHCEDVVRKYFEFRREWSMLSKYHVAVHIRLGDYYSQQHYHPVQTKEYYKQAFEKFGKQCIFIIFSDEKERAFNLFTKWFGNEYYIPESVIMTCDADELNYMSLFQNFITSNSTFSWWAAWLSKHPDKKIIQPSNWFGPAWNGTMDAKDIYIKNSIVI